MIKTSLLSTLITMLLFGIGNSVVAQEFTKVTSLGGNNHHYIAKTVVDNNGNFYHLGYFQGSIQIGNSYYNAKMDYDVFLYKTNAEGEVQWTSNFYSLLNSEEAIRDLVIDDLGENIYVSCGFNSNLSVRSNLEYKRFNYLGTANVVIQFDADGKVINSSIYGNPDLKEVKIAVSKSNKVYMAGYYYNSRMKTNQSFVSRLNLNKQKAWFHNLGDANDNVTVLDIEVSDSNNIYISGSFNESISFSTLSNRTFNSYSEEAAFILSINDKEEFIGFDILGNTSHGTNFQISRLKVVDQDIYFTGIYKGILFFPDIQYKNYTDDFRCFYGKMHKDGIGIGFTTTYTGELKQDGGEAIIEDIAVDEIGNLLLTGYFMGNLKSGSKSIISNGMNDLMYIKIDSEGKVFSMLSAGSRNNDKAFSIAQYNQEIYLTGSISDSASFGTKTIYSKKSTIDGFIAQFSAAGISFLMYNDTLCQYDDFEFYIKSIGVTDATEYKLFISDKYGSFDNEIELGSQLASTSDTLKANMNILKPESTGYKLKLKSSNPEFEFDYEHKIFVNETYDAPMIIGPTIVDEYEEAKYNSSFRYDDESEILWFLNKKDLKSYMTSSNTLIVNWAKSTHSIIKVVQVSGKGCVSDTGTLKVTIGDAIGIETIGEKSLSVYPTLASQNITVDLSDFDHITDIEIYNANGGLVRSYSNIMTSSRFQINVNNFSQGTYFIVAKNSSGKGFSKFQKI